MYLVRYLPEGEISPRVGLIDAAGQLLDLPFSSLSEALRLPARELQAVLDAGGPPATAAGLLAPVDGRMEVWASGVTYRRSKVARIEESDVADVYSLVYEAERPELFFKSVPWKVVTDGQPIGIRADSALNVPEPELAVVANTYGEIIGYTVCNDVSSRSIEGSNPLYLPQAKVYAGSCALAPAIRLAGTLPDPLVADITCTITRAGAVVWTATTSSSELRRSPSELLLWLFRQDFYPDGAVLSTGTGLVPELDTALAAGDVVEIDIAEVGRLRNTVEIGTPGFSWLTAPADHHSSMTSKEIP
jgi:2-dehydro-3-deoxy-D-arabinonate dehydratase